MRDDWAGLVRTGRLVLRWGGPWMAAVLALRRETRPLSLETASMLGSRLGSRDVVFVSGVVP